MSKPVMPRSDSAPLPTRRQLDELDALLQRMLELPVSHSAEPTLTQDQRSEVDSPPFAETSAWTSRWDETTSTSESDREPFVPTSSESPTEWHSRWTQSADAATNLADPSSTGLPSLYSENAQPEQEVPSSQPWEDTTVGPAIVSREEPLAYDAKADRVKNQRPTFQVLLGWLGLLCLVASLALLAYDWFGWTW
jgi:hypothetical protein